MPPIVSYGADNEGNNVSVTRELFLFMCNFLVEGCCKSESRIVITNRTGKALSSSVAQTDWSSFCCT